MANVGAAALAIDFGVSVSASQELELGRNGAGFYCNYEYTGSPSQRANEVFGPARNTSGLQKKLEMAAWSDSSLVGVYYWGYI